MYGEGEWKVRQHGASKRRTWIKVHLAVDTKLLDIIGVEVTTPAWADGEVFEGLLNPSCPKGDDRGKVYSVTNYKNNMSFVGVDAWHLCGGA